jgi:glucose-1-phosphate adenylyltransferase
MRPASDTIVMLLAGGVGSRLNIMGRRRAKPAVPFGGAYRIIDFTLSNVMHSGLERVGLLTQYKPLSLMDHVGRGEPWDLMGRGRGVRILPPSTGEESSDWYKGTADAIYQNMGFVKDFSPDKVLILSGDHIYRMDYEPLIAAHEEKGADLTIAAMEVPWDEVHRFGVMVTDESSRIVEFQEKVKGARSNLASMGIYVFSNAVLSEELKSVVGTRRGFDFGKDIIPGMLGRKKLFCYPFKGYWRDVGTIKSYLDANMDCLNPASGLDLREWQIRTAPEASRMGDRTPIRVLHNASVENTIAAPGAVIEGDVKNSVLFGGVRIGRGSVVRDSVIMHDTVVGERCFVDYSILDKECALGDGTVVGAGDPYVPNEMAPSHLDCGISIVGKGAVLGPGSRIGKNCIIYPGVDLKRRGISELGDGGTVTEELE